MKYIGVPRNAIFFRESTVCATEENLELMISQGKMDGIPSFHVEVKLISAYGSFLDAIFPADSPLGRITTRIKKQIPLHKELVQEILKSVDMIEVLEELYTQGRSDGVHDYREDIRTKLGF